MTDNPYAAPESLDEIARTGSADGILGVENNRILCVSPVVMPQYCVKTGTTDDLVEVRKKLYWAPSWVWILILLNLIAVAIAYLITRKNIEVVYWVNRSQRTKFRVRNALGLLMFIAGIAVIMVGAINEMPLGMLAGLALLILGLVFLVRYGAIVKPASHRDGVFQLSGFGPEFLSVVREHTS